MRRAIGLALAGMLLVATPASAKPFEVWTDREWCEYLVWTSTRSFVESGFVEQGFADVLARECVTFLWSEALRARSESGVGRAPEAFLEIAGIDPATIEPVPTPDPDEVRADASPAV